MERLIGWEVGYDVCEVTLLQKMKIIKEEQISWMDKWDHVILQPVQSPITVEVWGLGVMVDKA
jgi:hypothetical protein